MKRSERSINKRKKLVHLAINDRVKAARIIKKYAEKIETARTTNESVRVLSDLLGVSESTVFKDYTNYI